MFMTWSVLVMKTARASAEDNTNAGIKSRMLKFKIEVC